MIVKRANDIICKVIGKITITERRGRLVNISASYSQGVWFRVRISALRHAVIFSTPSKHMS
jgi:hypothetical protein